MCVISQLVYLSGTQGIWKERESFIPSHLRSLGDCNILFDYGCTIVCVHCYELQLTQWSKLSGQVPGASQSIPWISPSHSIQHCWHSD